MQTLKEPATGPDDPPGRPGTGQPFNAGQSSPNNTAQESDRFLARCWGSQDPSSFPEYLRPPLRCLSAVTFHVKHSAQWDTGSAIRGQPSTRRTKPPGEFFSLASELTQSVDRAPAVERLTAQIPPGFVGTGFGVASNVGDGNGVPCARWANCLVRDSSGARADDPGSDGSALDQHPRIWGR